MWWITTRTSTRWCATLYELLTLRPAFDAANRPDLLQQIAFEEPIAPRRVVRFIPTELETIVLKGLSKDPSQRYDTAESFAADLQAFLVCRPIQAKPSTLVQRCTKWCLRHRALSWSVVVLLLLTTVGSALGTAIIWQEQSRTAAALLTERAAKNSANVALRNETEAKREAERQAELASSSLYLANMRQAQQDWEDGQIKRFHAVLEQHLPAAGEPDRRRWEWYYLLSLCRKDLLTFDKHDAAVTCVSWNADGTRVASASGLSIQVWDADTGQTICTLRGHTAAIWTLMWHPDGSRLASSGDDHSVKIWNAQTGLEETKLDGHGQVRSLAWSHDGRFLAWGAAEIGTVAFTIRDVAHDREHLHTTLDTAGTPRVAWRPNTHTLAVLEYDRVSLWDVDESKQIRSWAAPFELWTVAWSPDGDRLATGGYNEDVTVWESDTGKERMRIARDSAISSVDWSPDGRFLAIATWGQKVFVRDANSGEELAVLRGHAGKVLAVAWSPDGSRLATGSDDRTVKIWDAPSGGTAPDQNSSGGTEGFLSRNGKYRIQHRNWRSIVRPRHQLIISSSDDPEVVLVQTEAELGLPMSLHGSRIAFVLAGRLKSGISMQDGRRIPGRPIAAISLAWHGAREVSGLPRVGSTASSTFGTPQLGRACTRLWAMSQIATCRLLLGVKMANT